MTKTALLAALLLINSAAQAATLIEVKTPQGQTQVWRDGSMSRMETQNDGYMVVDSVAETMFIVMTKERRVMDMSDLLRSGGNAAGAQGVRVEFKKLGEGPRIAGYPTARYSYTADGTPCGSVAASPQALKDAGLQDTLEMMQRMATRADALMSAFNHRADPCQRAGTQLSQHAGTIGVPMRINDANGRLVSEILRIDKNARLPANAFAIPSGYQVINTGSMLKQLPNMQDMMRQMQQR